MKPRVFRPRPGPAITVLLALASATAQAAASDIAWAPNGVFERQLDVAPGASAELCGKLKRGTKVTWNYQAAAPLDFNIHYHEPRAVMFPVQKDATARAEGTLPVDKDQDYCWMWTNKGAAPVALKVRLAR